MNPKVEAEAIHDCEYYYARINPDIERSFSHEQRQEIKRTLKSMIRIPSKKIIDFRTSVWFLKRLYLAVFVGTIDGPRIAPYEYSDKTTFIRFALKVFVYGLELFLLLLVLVAIAYTFKSMLGIDIIPDQHAKDVLMAPVLR